MSLENLLRIRPDGVTSKKAIGEFMIDFSIRLCTCIHCEKSTFNLYLERSPSEGDEDAGSFEEAKDKHGHNDETIDQLVEAKPWIIVDNPFELLFGQNC